MDIKRVCILGAGTMGLQIGLLTAAAGFETRIYDPYPEALDAAKKRVGRLAEKLSACGRITKAQAEKGVATLRFTDDPETAGRDADLINESVPEDPGIKAEVFSIFNAVCPDHTVFTTNTSTLVPSMMAEATGRPDRFAALHFHDCQLTNVVDIMPHPGTSEKTLQLIRSFCRAINQFPIELKKEQHGYVFNTMLTEWMASALTLASREVAAVEDIDRAWMGIMHSPVGPFGIMDAIGLGTVHKVTDYWAEQKQDPKARKNAAFVKRYVDRGDLGVKTGKGFYDYPNPAFAAPEFLAGIH